MTERLSDSIPQERFDAVAENCKRLSERIEAARQKAGRTDAVHFMGVTKTVAPELINHSVGCGIKLLGENRVQEFLDKRGSYDKSAEVHFIGGLQSNKVKYIIDKVSMIHSADSGKLIAEIDRRAKNAGIVMDILIEINIGGEESKSGIKPEELDELANEAAELGGVRVRGLMTIPPVDVNGSSERYFEQMQRLYSDLKGKTSGKTGFMVDTLSMGMSGDFETAIMYGSNIVRIGSLLYGYRKY